MNAELIFNPTAFLHAFVFFLIVLIGSFLLGLIFTVITALISFSSRPISASTPQTQLSPQHPPQYILFLNTIIASLTNPYCTTFTNKSDAAKV